MSGTTAACADDQEELRHAADLLPPDRLVLREDTGKVTLALSRRSVAFLEREAAKQRAPYQRMMRALVDAYARRLG
jgi:predicted DNA binding CopG/RHH family protein